MRRSIESAYAGGVKGREVIDVLLPDVHVDDEKTVDG